MRNFLRLSGIFFIAVIFLFLIALPVSGQSRGTQSLDDAIYNSVKQIIDEPVFTGTIIVYQFESHNARLSQYILREIFNHLVNSGRYIVLDRTSQEVIDAEMDYISNQDIINDASLTNISKRIGAEAIVTGSLDDLGDEYRFRIRVIGTQTTSAIASYVGRINKNDPRIESFTGRERGTGHKIGIGALNILLGLGSYIDGDILSGALITSGYVISAGLFTVEALLLDWSNPLVGVPATIGISLAGITFIYGFAAPFIYNRSPRLAALMNNLQPEIVPVVDSNGNNQFGFRLTYTIEF